MLNLAMIFPFREYPHCLIRDDSNSKELCTTAIMKGCLPDMFIFKIYLFICFPLKHLKD